MPTIANKIIWDTDTGEILCPPADRVEARSLPRKYEGQPDKFQALFRMNSEQFFRKFAPPPGPVGVFATNLAPDSLSRRFEMLAEEWRDKRPPTSSPSELAMHPAYQRIIALGEGAVPLILGAMKGKPDWWFWALRTLTGADPVEPGQRGKLRAMTEVWLEWGRRHGHIE